MEFEEVKKLFNEAKVLIKRFYQNKEINLSLCWRGFDRSDLVKEPEGSLKSYAFIDKNEKISLKSFHYSREKTLFLFIHELMHPLHYYTRGFVKLQLLFDKSINKIPKSFCLNIVNLIHDVLINSQIELIYPFSINFIPKKYPKMPKLLVEELFDFISTFEKKALNLRPLYESFLEKNFNYILNLFQNLENKK